MNKTDKNEFLPVKSGGSSRREFLQQASLLTAGAALLSTAKANDIPVNNFNFSPPGAITVTLNINGKNKTLEIDPRVTLLDALREEMKLTGTKKGCDRGQCGACTVLADGRRINSCLTLAVMCDQMKIVTIEGLGTVDHLHPMQAAFLKHDAFQCGYCTPGQICSAVALLKEGHAQTDEEIKESMSGNLCRCGAYRNILDAIKEVKHAG